MRGVRRTWLRVVLQGEEVEKGVCCKIWCEREEGVLWKAAVGVEMNLERAEGKTRARREASKVREGVGGMIGRMLRVNCKSNGISNWHGL